MKELLKLDNICQSYVQPVYQLRCGTIITFALYRVSTASVSVRAEDEAESGGNVLQFSSCITLPVFHHSPISQCRTTPLDHTRSQQPPRASSIIYRHHILTPADQESPVGDSAPPPIGIEGRLRERRSIWSAPGLLIGTCEWCMTQPHEDE